MATGELDLTGPPAQPATGFWRLARPGGAARTWLIGPDGVPAFVLGVNAVMRDAQLGGVPRSAGIGDYLRRCDPVEAAHLEWARLSSGESGGREAKRPYWFNSVGAFSQRNDIDDTGGDSYMIRPPELGGAGAPYSAVLEMSPRGDDRALRDEDGELLHGGVSGRRMGDPFNPAFLADLDAEVAEEVVPRRDDPRLQMWFAGNEIGVFDMAQKGRAGVRDFRRWIWSDVPPGSSIDRPLCARHALAAFLRDRYRGVIGDLNAAWNGGYPDFAAIVDDGPRPVPFVHDCNDRCGEDLQVFVHDGLLREWVRAITSRVRAADPNHLVATPRLAIATPTRYRFWTGPPQRDPDRWTESPSEVLPADTRSVRYCPLDLLGRDGDAGFDLVAVNAYTGAPTFPRPWFSDGLHRLQSESGLPVIISEFGLRARIDGWSNRGGAGSFVPGGDRAGAQVERGRRYRSQIDQFAGFRHVVGAHWHAWSDRFIPTDPSLQINLGIVQVTDRERDMQAGRRWEGLAPLIAETNRTILERIAAKTGY